MTLLPKFLLYEIFKMNKLLCVLFGSLFDIQYKLNISESRINAAVVKRAVLGFTHSIQLTL